MNIFGFKFERARPSFEPPITANAAISFVEKNESDTSAVIAASTSFGTYVDLQGTIKTEAELITKYRDMMTQPEVLNASSEVVNESIATDESYVIKIDLDDIPLDDNSKMVITNEFNQIQKLYSFKQKAYDIFMRWYVDGRLYYQLVIDNQAPELGIQEVRYIDPRKIRKIKEVERKKLRGVENNQSAADVLIVKNEYYLYNEKGFGGTNKQTPALQGAQAGGIRIATDSIVFVPSGITDSNGLMTIGHLHQAMKILSQLRTMEDSLIIYRLARAPERRAWYVNVGDLPPMKAEQYLQSVASSQKNRLIYDADTGVVRDDRKFLTMWEDYWIPIRSDGTGNKVETLQGGKTLGEIEDIVYFQKQLYNALNVPVGRLNPDAPFMLGRTQEISRDEIKFDKFITRIRQKFSEIFTITLGRQLVLKGMMTIEEWEALAPDIKYEFARDNHFAELKDQEIIALRAQTAMQLQPFIGTYFSHRYVQRNIFKQTDEDIMKMREEIAEEMADPLYQMMNQMMMGGGEGGGGQEEGGGQPGEGGGSGGSEGESATAKQYQTDAKVDDAKHIIQALKDIKGKSPKEQEKLRSAAAIVAKNSKQ